MNQIKSLFAFRFMLVATLFTASDAQAFALGNHVGGFFLGTLDCAGVDDAGTRNPCLENGWLNYDTLSGYCVAANKGGLNLFRWGKKKTTNPNGWKQGDRMLHLTNKGTPKANWKQNSGRLREEMRRNEPIFDSYRNPNTGKQIPSGVDPSSKGRFLNAERKLLES